MASRLACMTVRTAAVARPLLHAAPRRDYHATSSAEGSRAGNKDWPWILGSAVVFVPIAYFVVSKTARKHGENIAHQADTSRNTLEKHEANAPNPAPWPENRQKVDNVESVNTYTEADSPKGLMQVQEESPMNEISDEELISTIERELKSDAPKTARKAEEEQALKYGVSPPAK